LWLSPLWRGPCPLFEFPPPKDNLYQDRFNLACWFWRRRFTLLLQYYLPLGEGLSPFFEQT
jgi:hypothetical protein